MRLTGRTARQVRWLLLASVALGPLSRAVPSAGAAPTPCATVAAAEPQTGHNMPPPAPVMFAADFPALTDCEWGYPMGGWGGVRRLFPLQHVPVIFVHGNQVDAENWFLVADQFKALAGYTDQEMYALSYNGLENYYAGAPTRSTPSPRTQAYLAANPTALSNGGKGASDDTNVPDLVNFIHAVQAYTGSRKVEIVAHSLGGTIVRKTMADHPELYQDAVAVVLIATANHGTTVCRGLVSSYYGCDEIAPGSAWLDRLNARGQAVGPTRWMSIYNGTDGSDPFFGYAPGAFDDRPSPHLDGAINLTYPTMYHNDLRVDPSIVPVYLKFLQEAAAAASATPVAQPVTPVLQGLPNTSR